MADLTLRLDVPEGFEDRAKLLLERLFKQIQEEIKFSLARDILEQSELTEEQAEELGREVSSATAKRHL